MPERPYPSNQQRRGKTVVRLAWFTPEHYETLLKAAKADHDLDADYDTWYKRVRKLVKKTMSQGERVAKVAVDADAFVAWCKKHDKPVNSESLDAFVTLPLGE